MLFRSDPAGGSSGGIFQALLGAFFGGGSGGFGGAGSPLATGGTASPFTLHQVNERGFEMATVGGRDYMMTGPQPVEVTPNHKLGGGGITQIFNNKYAAPQDPRTIQQQSQWSGYQAKRALARNGA